MLPALLVGSAQVDQFLAQQRYSQATVACCERSRRSRWLWDMRRLGTTDAFCHCAAQLMLATSAALAA